MPADTACRLPELEQLERLLEHRALNHEVLQYIDGLPLYKIEVGQQGPDIPVLFLVGGIHGNEAIGSQILLAWLEHLLARLTWDSGLQALFERVRIVMLPLVNVTGLEHSTRANAEGIDLMRNSPMRARGLRLWPLAGQTVSPKLPWYRGSTLTLENQAIIKVMQHTRQTANFVLAMDLHSGFGTHDRLWFPYAAHRQPPAHLAEAVALCDLFNGSYPLHDFYTIEPQSLSYTTHGDLWDHLYDTARMDKGPLLLPFTLEIGSWLWLRKNPRQIFNRLGLFHPVLPHRLRRVLRRHWSLLEFLLRATADHKHWIPTPETRPALNRLGIQRWYTKD